MISTPMRERLREIAKRLLDRDDAAVLRELADSLDAEMVLARQKTNESLHAANAQALACWHIVQAVLARLDAPVDASPMDER